MVKWLRVAQYAPVMVFIAAGVGVAVIGSAVARMGKRAVQMISSAAP